MLKDEILWVEKYRPRTLDTCVLPEDLKKTFAAYIEKEEIPNLLLSGQAGGGKSTIGKVLCESVGCDYITINLSTENGIDTLRNKITLYASSVSLSGGRKMIIGEEADNMSPQLQQGLRGAIEEFSKNCGFIFTCNYKNKIIDPIQSRCSVIEFKINAKEKQQLMAKFFKRVCFVLDQEGIKYNKEVLASLVSKYFPDYRRTINELQRYASFGPIDTGILTQVADVNINEIVKILKAKDFSKSREWLYNNTDIDSVTLFRKIYDQMYDFLKPNSLPLMVLLLDEYQDKAGRVADPIINIMSFFVKCMSECEFK